MAGQSTAPLREGYREPGQGRRPEGRRPCPARAQVSPLRRFRAPQRASPLSPQDLGRPLLPAAVRAPACGHRLLLARESVGLQRAATGECGWCNGGRRQSRHHLFTECSDWAPQIRRLWRRVGKDCGWRHSRAPSARWLWREEATEAVLEFLEGTRVGCWSSRVDEDRGAAEARKSEGQEGGLGPP